MLNHINMEFYRLKKSKAFYVLLFLLGATYIANIVLTKVTGIIDFDTVAEAISRNLSSGNLLLFAVILFMLYIGDEFHTGYIKNIGSERYRVVLSKLPVIAISLLAFFILNVLMISIGYSISLPEIPFGELPYLFKTIGMYYILHFAVGTAVMTVGIAVRNTTGALAISLLWPTGLFAFSYAMLELLQQRIFGGVYIRFTRILADAYIVARPNPAEGEEIVYILGISLIYIAVCILLSLFIMKKRDIR